MRKELEILTAERLTAINAVHDLTIVLDKTTDVAGVYDRYKEKCYGVIADKQLQTLSNKLVLTKDTEIMSIYVMFIPNTFNVR